MGNEFDAIYENGVLRPLKAVRLRKHEVVTVSIGQCTPDDAFPLVLGARQREILLSFVAKMESLADRDVADVNMKPR